MRIAPLAAVLSAALCLSACTMTATAAPASETPPDPAAEPEPDPQPEPPEPEPEPQPPAPEPEPEPEPEPKPPTPPAEARYRVTFTSTWSASTHPQNFPGSPHFSGLVGATHKDVRIWQSGQAASDGMELMAETGAKVGLFNEIIQLIANGSAHTRLSGGGVSTSPGTVSLEFTAVASHPFVTLVSMLAPSPDWFVGVSALALLEDGAWKARVEVPLIVYDAGTDDGARFTSANADSDPAQPITPLTSDPGDTDFTDGKPAVGSFVFERL